MPECFFAHLGGCDGRLVRAHLIPKQRIAREVEARGTGLVSTTPTPIRHIVWDERAWVWMCGGPTGVGGHHGAFDNKQIRLNYTELPTAVKEFAEQYGLEWSLERDYAV